MKLPSRHILAVVMLIGLGLGCNSATSQEKEDSTESGLIGAWRSRIQFTSGPYASVKDLDFMYIFNDGGTMMESSNYDAAPPVPPAYGMWRKVGENQYEAKYEFYSTRVPDSTEHMPPGTGWLPSGYGVLTETITMSQDGKSFKSAIKFEAFDVSGKAISGGGGEAVGEARRITF